MDDHQFQSVLKDVATGVTTTDACLKVLSTTAHLMIYLAKHPEGMAYQAALWQAEGDSRIGKSDNMLEKLSDRVGGGFVTTPAVARIETDQINKLRTEGFNMRDRAARLLSKLHKAEQDRVAKLNAPPQRRTSWADAPVAPAQAVELVERAFRDDLDPQPPQVAKKITPPSPRNVIMMDQKSKPEHSSHPEMIVTKTRESDRPVPSQNNLPAKDSRLEAEQPQKIQPIDGSPPRLIDSIPQAKIKSWIL